MKKHERETNEFANQFIDEIDAELNKMFNPKASERDKYHVVLDKKKFDEDGNKVSVPIQQIFEKEEWSTVEPILKSQGFKIEILWNPNAQ